MADIFISYSRKDEAVASDLAARLEEAGRTVWIDRNIAGGSEFSDVIEREIDRAGTVIALWSKDSIHSRWVRDEAQAALEQDKLLPTQLDGTPPPLGFRQLQAIDISTWAKGRRDSLPPELAASLRLAGNAPPSPSPDPPRKRPLLVGLAALALLVMAVAAAMTLWPRSDGPSQSDVVSDAIPVVVHPLATTGDADAAALAAGITDELIVRLRRVDGLRIASTRTADEPAPPGFESAHVVEGRIRQDGERLRLAVRLLDADGAVVWSDAFDRQLTDLFTVQEEIAAAVAGALSVSLDVGFQSSSFGGTSDPEAYLLYVQGRTYRGDDDPSRPINALERAVSLDPTYARAYAELTYAYGISLYDNRDEANVAPTIARMDEVSARALEVAPEAWSGHAARGWYAITRKDFVTGDRLHRQVAEMDRGDDPELRNTVANFDIMLGRYERSLALRKSKALIDPLFADYDPDIIRDLLNARRYDELLQSPTGSDPERSPYPLVLMWAHYMTGDREAGDRVATMIFGPGAERLVQPGQFDPRTYPDLAGEELSAWADEMFGAGGRRRIGFLAHVAGFRGETGRALDYLEIAFLQRPGMGNYFLLWHPALAETRQTERFKRLVTDLGMVDAWRASGEWGDFCRPVGEDDFECS